MDGYIDPQYISHLVKNKKKSYKDISEILKRHYPEKRGLSERSIRRFCKEHDITTRSGIDDKSLDRLVHNAVRKVGPTWGRRMVTGYLRSNGVNVSERRVGKSLVHVAPSYHRQRHNRTEQQTNPIPYSAEYFGHKLHIDQNEKLNMYGVVHVCAIDGFSGKIVSHALMPVKNNLTIYEGIYRSSVLTYGLWDQLRVDKGREFCLMLYIQDMLSRYRRNTSRLPYMQTTSCKNHRIERMWGEFNTRVNYPVKRVLNSLVENGVLDMDDDITKHSVSWVTQRVCYSGCHIVIDSWNSHFVRGRGTPNDLQAQNCKTVPLQSQLLPVTTDAVKMYEESGGQLTYWPMFGTDPLSSYPHLITARDTRFCQQFSNFSEIFSGIVHGHSATFQSAVLLHRDLTYHFCP